MRARRRADQAGFSLLEVLVGCLIGSVVLLGLGSLYAATVRAFSESSSQAALQRVGALTLQAISRQTQGASHVSLTCANPAVPANTTGRSLEAYVPTIPHPDSSDLTGDNNGVYYCYYVGTGTNGAAAGALCQRRTPKASGAVGTAGTCWNLLAAPQPGAFRVASQTGGVSLIKQTSPVSRFCPTNTDGTAIATNLFCLALGQSTGPGGQDTGDLAFAITDGMNSMTITVSLTGRN